MDQILQRGRSAPVAHNRTFSLTLNQTQNNPLVRKDEPTLSSGLHVTSACLVSLLQLKTQKYSCLGNSYQIVFSFLFRTSAPTLKFVTHALLHHGLAKRFFKLTAMWQLQGTPEPNLAVILRPTAQSIRLN